MNPKCKYITDTDVDSDSQYNTQPPINLVNEYRSLPVTTQEKANQIATIDSIPYIDDCSSTNETPNRQNDQIPSDSGNNTIRQNDKNIQDILKSIKYGVQGDEIDDNPSLESNIKVTKSYTQALPKNRYKKTRSHRSKTGTSDKFKVIETNRKDYLTSSMDAPQLKGMMKNPRYYGRIDQAKEDELRNIQRIKYSNMLFNEFLSLKKEKNPIDFRQSFVGQEVTMDLPTISYNQGNEQETESANNTQANSNQVLSKRYSLASIESGAELQTTQPIYPIEIKQKINSTVIEDRFTNQGHIQRYIPQDKETDEENSYFEKKKKSISRKFNKIFDGNRSSSSSYGVTTPLEVNHSAPATFPATTTSADSTTTTTTTTTATAAEDKSKPVSDKELRKLQKHRGRDKQLSGPSEFVSKFSRVLRQLGGRRRLSKCNQQSDDKTCYDDNLHHYSSTITPREAARGPLSSSSSPAPEPSSRLPSPTLVECISHEDDGGVEPGDHPNADTPGSRLAEPPCDQHRRSSYSHGNTGDEDSHHKLDEAVLKEGQRQGSARNHISQMKLDDLAKNVKIRDDQINDLSDQRTALSNRYQVRPATMTTSSRRRSPASDEPRDYTKATLDNRKHTQSPDSTNRIHPSENNNISTGSNRNQTDHQDKKSPEGPDPKKINEVAQQLYSISQQPHFRLNDFGNHNIFKNDKSFINTISKLTKMQAKEDEKFIKKTLKQRNKKSKYEDSKKANTPEEKKHTRVIGDILKETGDHLNNKCPPGLADHDDQEDLDMECSNTDGKYYRQFMDYATNYIPLQCSYLNISRLYYLASGVMETSNNDRLHSIIYRWTSSYVANKILSQVNVNETLDPEKTDDELD